MTRPAVVITPNKHKTEISPWQLFMILSSVPFSTFTAFTPLLSSAPGVSRDAWMAAVGAALVATGALWLVYLYARKFPAINLGQAIRITFGPVIGSGLNVAVMALFIVWAAINLKQFGFFFSGPIYPTTPTFFFSILFIGVCIMAAAEGIEFLGRVSEISGIIFVLGFIPILVSTAHLTEFTFLRPMLAENRHFLWSHFGVGIGVLGEVLWVGALSIPHLNDVEDAKKPLWWTTVMVASVALTATIWPIAIFDVELLSALTLPALSTIRLISFGSIFERLEWIAIATWIGTMGVKISLLLHGGTSTFVSLVPRVNRSVASMVIGLSALLLSAYVLVTTFEAFAFFRPEKWLPLALPLQLAAVATWAVASMRGLRVKQLPSDEVVVYRRPMVRRERQSN